MVVVTSRKFMRPPPTQRLRAAKERQLLGLKREGNDAVLVGGTSFSSHSSDADEYAHCVTFQAAVARGHSPDEVLYGTVLHSSAGLRYSVDLRLGAWACPNPLNRD